MAIKIYPLDEQTSIAFEVSDEGGLQPAGGLGHVLEGSREALQRSLESVQRSVGFILSQLRAGLPDEPDEIKVEFGLKIAAEVAGFIFAKATSEATYKVAMTWKK